MGRQNADRMAAGNGLVLLVADDDKGITGVCRDVAESVGLRVLEAGTAEEALEKAEQEQVDLALLDLRMPELGGMALLERLKQDYPHIEVILMTGYGSVETAVEAIKRGAYDYLAKPFHVDDLRAKLQHALTALELTQENRILREQARGQPGFGGRIGTAPKMQRLYKLILKVSQGRHPG